MYFEFKHLKNTRFEVVELLVSLVFALSCLFLLWFFPLSVNDLVENLMKLFFFLVIFPMAFTRIILKRSLLDLYIGKPNFTLKSSLFLLLSLIIGNLGFLIIFKSSLINFYKANLPSSAVSVFKGFLVYEIFIGIILLIYIFFTFGFLNLITENFPKLNLILVILMFYFLLLEPSKKTTLKDFSVTFLIVLPTIFFRRIVNEQRSFWSFYCLIFILNIVFNAIIIKLSI